MDAKTAALRRLTERVVAAGADCTPLDIRGTGTKSFYGGVPRGAPLPLGELSGVTSYEPTELVVTALAGTPLSELEALLDSRGQCLPFEPPRYGSGGTVGGMVATGLSGPARPSVGALRDHLLGVSLLNGTGETLTFGGQVMKNVAGYDLSRVLAGSMGILGVLCELSLKVMPMPAAVSTIAFDIEQGAALERLNHWGAQPYPLGASAWHDGRLWIRLAGAQAAVASVRQRLGGMPIEPGDAAKWWRDVRDQRHAFFDPGDAADRGEVLWRLSVPDTAPVQELPGEQFIEWGGALRWLRTGAPAASIRAAVASVGGHATLFRAADKSDGVFTSLSGPLMAIQRRLKQSFDPAGIFNPGRLYPDL